MMAAVQLRSMHFASGHGVLRLTDILSENLDWLTDF